MPTYVKGQFLGSESTIFDVPLAAAFAGVVLSLVLGPTELIKVRISYITAA